MNPPTRRRVLVESGLIAGSALALGAGNALPADRPRRILVVGGHPGDPEAGCGGTIARYVRQGHHVTCLYLTRGEAGIPGKSQQEAAAIRSAEAEKACRILGATPMFAPTPNRFIPPTSLTSRRPSR